VNGQIMSHARVPCWRCNGGRENRAVITPRLIQNGSRLALLQVHHGQTTITTVPSVGWRSKRQCMTEAILPVSVPVRVYGKCVVEGHAMSCAMSCAMRKMTV
jgi:hypothetical protein